MTQANRENEWQAMLRRLPAERETLLSYGAGFGLVFGVTFGAIMQNIGLWIALGLSIGAGARYVLADLSEKLRETDQVEHDHER